jgi:hypothetical protein
MHTCVLPETAQQLSYLDFTLEIARAESGSNCVGTRLIWYCFVGFRQAILSEGAPLRFAKTNINFPTNVSGTTEPLGIRGWVQMKRWGFAFRNVLCGQN